VRVEACGLCGTDIHLAVDGDLPVERTPITLGHEAAGVVAGAGADDGSVKEGDRVALFPAASCGSCHFCRIGRESLCDRSKVYGMARDGALAEYVTAPAASVIALPPEVPFDIGAVVTDAVATPFHALRARGALRAGETVGVVGCGGLGTHAIILARMMGASCIVAVRKSLRTAVPGGLDLVLECVGAAKTVQLAIRCLGKSGRAVLIGVGPERPELPPLVAFVGREQAVLGSFGMDRVDIEDLYGLIASGRLNLSESISARYPLAKANDALQHLARKEDAVVRVLVEPRDR